eukprot:Partr_v1_DN26926_c0_g1_i1_m7152 putative WNK lysine deficient protein kinase
MDNNSLSRTNSGAGQPQPDTDDEHTVVDCDPTGRFERYAKCLGMGAYKKVFLAFDTEEGVEVAWNELRIAHLQKKDIVKVLSEVQILQQVRHENIINLYHSWVANNQVYFITELMTSGTLKSYVRKMSSKNSLKPKVLKNWCRQILKGLHYLHSCDPAIIHRDLKCENIFINGNNGQAKIGDLGLATAKQRDYASSVLGTPEFMAPELYDEKYDEKVDIYSFGMCVLEMVTREYPYSECTNQAQIYRKVTNKIKPAALDTVEDADVRQFIEMCIAHDPDKRPSAAELLEHPFVRDAKTGPPPHESQAMGTTVHSNLSSPTMTASVVSPTTSSSHPSGTFVSVHQKSSPLSETSSVKTAGTTMYQPSLSSKVSGADYEAHQKSNIVSVQPTKFSFPVLTIMMICHSSDSASESDTQSAGKQEVKFPFNLEQDTPESVVEEMIREGVLTNNDKTFGVMWIAKIVETVMRDNGLLGDNSTTISSMESYATSRSDGGNNNLPLPVQFQQSPRNEKRIPANIRTRSRSMNAMDVNMRMRSISSPSVSAVKLDTAIPVVQERMSRPGHERHLSASSPSSPVSNRRSTRSSRRSLSVSGSGLSQSVSSITQPPLNVVVPVPHPPLIHTQPVQPTDATALGPEVAERLRSLDNTSTQSLPVNPNASASMSHYHRAIDQKTNEIIEGVYRSRFRRGTPAGIPGSTVSLPQTPIQGSGLNFPAAAPAANKESSSAGRSPELIQFHRTAETVKPISLPAPAIPLADTLQPARPSALSDPQAAAAYSAQSSRSVSRTSTNDTAMYLDIKSLKEKQKREAEELAKIHAVELLRLLQEHHVSNQRNFDDQERALHIPESFYSWDRNAQLSFLERELLDDPAQRSHIIHSDASANSSTNNVVASNHSAANSENALSRQQSYLSHEAERQLNALQQLAVSDFERQRQAATGPVYIAPQQGRSSTPNVMNPMQNLSASVSSSNVSSTSAPLPDFGDTSRVGAVADTSNFSQALMDMTNNAASGFTMSLNASPEQQSRTFSHSSHMPTTSFESRPRTHSRTQSASAVPVNLLDMVDPPLTSSPPLSAQNLQINTSGDGHSLSAPSSAFPVMTTQDLSRPSSTTAESAE